MKEKKERREIRKKRIRARVVGTKNRPRLCVFRSNKFIEAQIIDDVVGKTICAATDKEKKGKAFPGKKGERARAVGRAIAERAKEKKVKKIIFDRGGFTYAGRVKALAESAREHGLVF